MIKQYKAWAFRVNLQREGYTPMWNGQEYSRSFLAGIYYFKAWRQQRGKDIPYPIDTALFDTRKLARAAAKAEGIHGRAVKVKVTVEEIV